MILVVKSKSEKKKKRVNLRSRVSKLYLLQKWKVSFFLILQKKYIILTMEM